MKIGQTCLCALAFLLAPMARAQEPAKIRQLVEREAKKAGTQGVLFGLWKNDRELLTLALGNSMTTVPARTDMHFRIGGITETFQTTLLLKLVEPGKISLDDTIDRWFPGLLGADKVTVRMLAGNTAGYPDYVPMEEFNKQVYADPFRTWKDEELIQFAVSEGKLAYEPGTSQAYSHSEYVLLGQVLQRATQRSMSDLYEENILKPLGLKDTHFLLEQAMPEPVLHAFSNDRDLYEDCTFWNASWGSATGALVSNLHDLGIWGPAFGQGRLISPDHFREASAPVSVGKGHNRADAYFAYGFIVSNGWYLQNPNINGYSGAFGVHPATGTTVVVCATKNAKPAIDPAAIHILREVIKELTPESPLGF